MKKILLLTLLSALCVSFSSSAQIPEGVHILRVGETTVASNCYQLSGEQLTGQAFQQDALLTYRGYQYTVYYNATRNVCIARRKLPLGEWREVMLDHKNTADDAHDVISAGICANDGTIHLSYDHHNTTLHYRRSVIGLANDPEGMKWAASSFGPDINYLEAGVTVPDVTYPRFINKPDGNLLFECRYKLSGDGDSYLREYDGNTHKWTNIGRYVQGMDANPDACAYINRMDYDKFGKLHVSWCWRDDFGGGSNHDIFYGYSEDHGRTWKDTDGKQVAVSEKINPTDSRVSGACMRQGITSLKIATIAYNRGYINQESQSSDQQGRVHILNSYMPDGTGTDADWNSSRTKARLHHRFRAADGTWKVNQVKNNGATVNSYCRSQIVVDAFDNAYVIANGAEVYAATSAKEYADWGLVSSVDRGRFCSEPQVDHPLLLSDGVLSFVYLGNNKNVVVIDYLLDNPNTPSGTGLHAEYFSDTEATQLISEVPNQTIGNALLPGGTRSVRWSGTLETRYAERYTLYLDANGPAAVYVNGVKLMEKTTSGEETLSAQLPLVASHKQNIVIESKAEASAPCVTSLSWSSDRTPKEIIPATSLYDVLQKMKDDATDYPYTPDIPEADLDMELLPEEKQINVASGIDTILLPFNPAGNYSLEIKAKVASAEGRGLDVDARALNGNGFRFSMDPLSVNQTSPITFKIKQSASDNTVEQVLRFAVKGKDVHLYQNGKYVSTTTVTNWQGDLDAAGNESKTPAVSGENLAANWGGTTGNNSGAPTAYGWGCTGTSVPWNTANAGSGVRYLDVTHTLSTGGTYTGRMMTIRWDATSLNGAYYYFPVTLEANTAYKFSALCEWWSNTKGAITMGVSTNNNGTGILASQLVSTDIQSRLYEGSVTFATTLSGTYYLVFTGGNGMMGGIGALELNKITDTPRLIVGKNYVTGAADMTIYSVKYSEDAYAPAFKTAIAVPPSHSSVEVVRFYSDNHSVCINGIPSPATIGIYDVAGKLAVNQFLTSDYYFSPPLSPGIYIVLLSSPGHVFRGKVLVR